jgi:hypothetical protein
MFSIRNGFRVLSGLEVHSSLRVQKHGECSVLSEYVVLSVHLLFWVQEAQKIRGD